MCHVPPLPRNFFLTSQFDLEILLDLLVSLGQVDLCSSRLPEWNTFAFSAIFLSVFSPFWPPLFSLFQIHFFCLTLSAIRFSLDFWVLVSSPLPSVVICPVAFSAGWMLSAPECVSLARPYWAWTDAGFCLQNSPLRQAPQPQQIVNLRFFTS